LLAANPLPCILIFTSDKRVYSYSINGILIASLNNSSRNKIYPKIIRNSFFNDCLIYVDSSRKVIVAFELPSFNKVNSVLFDRNVSSFAVQQNGEFGLLGYEDGSFNFFHPSTKQI